MKVLQLKEYRESLKMSQQDIADVLNLTQQAYSTWEKGTALPNASQILKLCDIFKCTPNDLFGIKGVVKVVHAQMRGDLE